MGKGNFKAAAAAFLMLAALPFSLCARDGASGEPKNELTRLFSVSMAPARDSGPAVMTILVLSASPLQAASGEHSARALTRDFLKDAGEIWSYPLHIKGRDILPIAGLAALTGFLVANDEGIYRGFRDYTANHGWVRAASPVVTVMGSYGAWATAGAFLCFGLIARDDRSVDTAVLAASAMLQSELVVQAIKFLTGRQRPSWADGEDHWAGPAAIFKRFEKGQSTRYDSFPSGHAITAFSLATVLAMQYRGTVWVPIVSYSVAAGVGLSRLTENRHWLSDILVGGILGHFIGRLVVRNHRERYHLMPSAGLQHGSFSIAVTFGR
jgi:membrane-associated phospholipid phosphatase